MMQSENEMLNEIKRLTAESEIQQGFFNAAMDRAEKAEAKIAMLREELLRMVETFDGMGSALPGPAFGSGAIAKARQVLRETR